MRLRVSLWLIVLLALGLTAPAATFTEDGTTLRLSMAKNEALFIYSRGETYTFSTSSPRWTGTDSANAAAGVTGILTVTAAAFSAVTIDDEGPGVVVSFEDSGVNTYRSSFTITLDDPAAGEFGLNGATKFAGTASLTASTTGRIYTGTSSTLTMVDGDLTLRANQQTTPTAGAFTGIQLGGLSLVTTGRGKISLSGRSGDYQNSEYGIRVLGAIRSTSASPDAGTITLNGVGRGGSSGFGVYVQGEISSVSGAIAVTGTSLGTGSANDGVRVTFSGRVVSTGSGATAARIAIAGTAGNGTTGNRGVAITETSTMSTGITTRDGDVSIIGQGRGLGTLADGILVEEKVALRSTGSGSFTLNGTATPDGGTGSGVRLSMASTVVPVVEATGTSSIAIVGAGMTDADVTLKSASLGNAASSSTISITADTLSIDSASNVRTNAAGLVRITPRTLGRAIVLGGDDTTTRLGLTTAELARIQTGTLGIGDFRAASIDLLADLSFASTAVDLIASALNLNGHTLTAGVLTSTVAGQADLKVEQPAGLAFPASGIRNFGKVPQGNVADVAFVLRNFGFIDLDNLAVTIDGANAGEFSVLDGPTAPLPPGGSTTLTVRHTATTAGAKSATLHIASNDHDQSPFDINLTASSLPEIAVEQPAGINVPPGGSVALGSVAVGATSDRVFTIRNTGSSALSGFSATIDGADAARFSVVAAPAAPVAPGAGTTFTVRYTPTAAGLKSAVLHLASNAATNPFDISLLGGVDPDIAIEYPPGTLVPSGATLDFGNVLQGQSTTRYGAIRNTGTSDLTGLNVTIDGPDAAEFGTGFLSSTTVAPGAVINSLFYYSPQSPGTKIATAHVASSDPDENPYDIKLVGHSEPEIAITDAAGVALNDGGTKDYGPVILGQESYQTFTVTNRGFGDLYLPRLTVDGPDAAAFVINGGFSGKVVGSATSTYRSTSFTIVYHASKTGVSTATLHLVNTDADENPYDIQLTASSLPEIAVQGPDFADLPSGGRTHFGSVPRGGSADLVFTVKNVGPGDLTGLGITFDGPSAAEYSIVALPQAPVSPYTSTTFKVRLAPTSSGSKQATLHLASNDADESPFNLVLIGLCPSTTPLAGTRDVGPTGFYPSLHDALLDLQSAGVGAPFLLELQAGYSGAAEYYPLVFEGFGATALKNVTIRPQLGASGLSLISADRTAATVDLNRAQFVTIDGRPGGLGTAKELTIGNTDPAGVAVRFINDASGNALRYLTLQSVNTSASSGTVVFSTAWGITGNDNNTLDTCDLRDGATTPLNAIFSYGTTATLALYNSGNTVSNCNIFNFWGPDSSGILLYPGNTDWTISGNSFYQTATRVGAGGLVAPIYISSSPGSGFVITGNFLGGSAPHAGGAPWTMSDTTSPTCFAGVVTNTGTTTASSIQGNIVQNFLCSTMAGATASIGTWCGICVSAGHANVGTAIGNVIGSATGTGSVSVTAVGVGGTCCGIYSASSGTVAIANNTVGSIRALGSSPGVPHSIIGVQVFTGATSIVGNTIGSTSTANSISAETAVSSATAQQVTGLLSTSSATALISGNTVANLNNNYIGTSTTGQIRGIVTTSGVNSIVGNVVRNLSTTSLNAGTATSQSAFGIIQTSTVSGQAVSRNVVHSIANSATSAAVAITGIYFAGGTSVTSAISRNLIHSLALSSSSQASSVTGLQVLGGAVNVQNNMISLGVAANGTSTAGAAALIGLLDNGTTSGRSYLHNSISIGGTETTGASSSFAFRSLGFTNTRSVQNNIFVNSRSKGGTATGKHYAVAYGGSAPNPAGLTAGNNLFQAGGTNGVLGLFNFSDQNTLAAWQSATGVDAASLVGDPRFIAPAAGAPALDLHLQNNGSPAYHAGASTTGVRLDFDGGLRSASAPDLGADEVSVINTGPALAGVPSSAVLAEATGPSGASVTFPSTITANDHEDATASAVTLVSGGRTVTSGSLFPLGDSVVTATATDSEGVVSSATFLVRVLDTTPPVVAAHANSNATTTSDLGLVINYPAATATDAVGVTSLAYSQASGTLFPVGTTTVTVTARDAANNVGQQSFDVTITRIYTPTENWRRQYFQTAANAGDAADDADPDRDGLVNMLERALGTNPTDAKSGPSALVYNGTLAGGATLIAAGQPIVRMENGPGGPDLRALFSRRKDPQQPGETAMPVQFKADLADAQWVDILATPTVLADDGTLQIVSVPFPLLPDGRQARFVRLRAPSNP